VSLYRGPRNLANGFLPNNLLAVCHPIDTMTRKALRAEFIATISPRHRGEDG